MPVSDDTYLIEIRLAMTRWRIKESIASIASRYSITDFMERHPHVTLFGPLTLNPGVAEEQMLAAIARVASGYDSVPFMIGPWEKRDGMHGGVIAFSVQPSDSLKSLTRSIAEAVSPLVQSQNVWDAEPEWKWFHVTVANQLDRTVSEEVFADLSCASTLLHDSSVAVSRTAKPGEFSGTPPQENAERPILIDDSGLRITVMHGEGILAEYDLSSKRWITGDEISDKDSWQLTLAQFRKNAGFECTGTPRQGSGDIFFMADLHLGHANIIRYCSRPFRFPDAGEMDRVLTGNWNATIAPGDRAFFVGDLRYGRDAAPATEYASLLAGSIMFIHGNHDTDLPGSVESVTIEYGGLQFFIIHDPDNASPDFEGWIIHGHHHNNNLREFPFINFRKRHVNVSAEVIGYAPVTLREITCRIQDGINAMETGPVLLRYPHVRQVV